MQVPKTMMYVTEHYSSDLLVIESSEDNGSASIFSSTECNALHSKFFYSSLVFMSFIIEKFLKDLLFIDRLNICIFT